ncbi:gamma-butyrobetaine dioxygenase-like [Trichoplusia ni]|uniref:Gamma-butyrobetaine dioxygenase-like n=1 Tax=Trichoplusia ni TaxID=7111 RepID=A0A7E5WEP3_TRINI|nr:gamma-butyrobetaine dioxygenase-like [Trichoplusia ni]
MFALRLISCAKNFVKSVPNISGIKQIHINKVLHRNKSDEFIDLVIRGESLQFPNVWLRENCQCEQCYHKSAQSRILDWSKFDLNVKPKYVSKDQNSLQVTWEDGHSSQYNLNWLKFRGFTPENQKTYSETIYKPKQITWHTENFDEIFSKHDYNEILSSNEALYNWLYKLSVYGVALIQNTPDSDTAIDAVVNKIGFTKRTHYGVKFVVRQLPNTSNVAYLSSNLQMHTDLPYYEYCPGANLLHCLVQTASQGGENMLSDCHYTAEYMKVHHPDQYSLLTDIEVEWRDVGVEDGNEFFKLHRAPVICLDRHGEITRINFSIPQRGSHFPMAIELVKPWYEAHSMFLALNQKFAAKFKTKAGDILTFNNIRLLHGRNAYEDSENNVRQLIGAYVDWDEIYSRLRCLKIKLNNEDGIC